MPGRRLVYFRSTSDGYISAGLTSTLTSIFEREPEFLLRNTCPLKGAGRDRLYHDIIDNLYGGFIFDGAYPPRWDEWADLGPDSKRFMRIYEH